MGLACWGLAYWGLTGWRVAGRAGALCPRGVGNARRGILRQLFLATLAWRFGTRRHDAKAQAGKARNRSCPGRIIDNAVQDDDQDGHAGGPAEPCTVLAFGAPDGKAAPRKPEQEQRNQENPGHAVFERHFQIVVVRMVHEGRGHNQRVLIAREQGLERAEARSERHGVEDRLERPGIGVGPSQRAVRHVGHAKPHQAWAAGDDDRKDGDNQAHAQHSRDRGGAAASPASDQEGQED